MSNMEPREQMAGKEEAVDLLAAITPDLVKIEQAMQADLTAIAPDIAPLLNEILHYGLFAGGKRIRPLLAVLCSRLCGGTDSGVVSLSIAFEYLHCATLFHDDVIDQAVTRRGKAAVNVAYGETAAILAGDFLHARSMLLVGRGGGIEALEVFCEATAAMVDGEFLQLRNASMLSQNHDEYFAVIMGKTARLIGAACEIGALVAGAGVEASQALRNYGLHLGCAFQIIDDLLDYQGDTVSTGKAVGNDFCEGKMTLPLILALNKAQEKDRQRLLSMLAGGSEERVSLFAEATALISRYEGFTRARRMAEEMADKARAQLQIFDQEAVRQTWSILESLISYVLNRKK
jgi:octaprenyl-diphosphate synthase